MPLLTKSAFLRALECSSKVYYFNNKTVYADSKKDDDFLSSLADGGRVIGELAKQYYPGGIEVETWGQEAVDDTKALMQRENVTIFEAAFATAKFYLRADIVVKEGKKIKLIEVKSKSFSSSNPEIFSKNGGVDSNCQKYVYDLAFQFYVLRQIYGSEYELEAYLLLVDKDKKASVDKLYQYFEFKQNGSRTEVRYKATANELGDQLLSAEPLTEQINKIISEKNFNKSGKSFSKFVEYIGDLSVNDRQEYASIGKQCKKCEFTSQIDKPDLKNGWMECWQQAFPKLGEDELLQSKCYDVWHSPKIAGKVFMAEIEPDNLKLTDLNYLHSLDGALSRSQRQWLQVKAHKESNMEPHIRYNALKTELDTLIYPLNFIDFEAFRSPLPFYKGMRPNEIICFQFSHHILHKDGRVEHASEWIAPPQEFPNFEMVRGLQKALAVNSGSIFRYHDYENVVLNNIKEQLKASNEADKTELIDFISSITQITGKNKICGERNMIDLQKYILKYCYYPEAGGSNSIKHLLPAILNASDFLKEKYSSPVYGTSMPSRNFKNWAWVQEENGSVINPYKLLDPFYSREIDALLYDDEDDASGIADGGAAMTAYIEMHYKPFTPEQIDARLKSLLRYCELDTLAMVMVMEGMMEVTKKIKS